MDWDRKGLPPGLWQEATAATRKTTTDQTMLENISRMCQKLPTAAAAIAMTAVLMAAETLAEAATAAPVQKNEAYLKYIDKYKKAAIQDMRQYGIPASITLAQGLLESGAGKSELAALSNNHFGIKCHDWKGDRVYYDDDEKNECFRKYDDPDESYKDHAEFLRGKPRYASLFTLKSDDYKEWAKGLKRCGYATDPNYAPRLISIIETYELYKLDKDLKLPQVEITRPDGEKQAKDNYRLKSSMGTVALNTGHSVEKRGRKKVVIASAQDTYEGIAKEFGLKKWEIRWYNHVKKGAVPAKGTAVIISKF